MSGNQMSEGGELMTGERDLSFPAIALTIYSMTTKEEPPKKFIHINVEIEQDPQTGEEAEHDPANNPAHRAMERIIGALPYLMDGRWETLVMPLLSVAGGDTQVAGNEQEKPQ